MIFYGKSNPSEKCGSEYEQKKDWQKFCTKKCAGVARMERYWIKRIKNSFGVENDKI